MVTCADVDTGFSACFKFALTLQFFGEIGDVHIVSHGAEQIPSYVFGETVLVLTFLTRCAR